jgi:hypothetical protein
MAPVGEGQAMGKVIEPWDRRGSGRIIGLSLNMKALGSNSTVTTSGNAI